MIEMGRCERRLIEGLARRTRELKERDRRRLSRYIVPVAMVVLAYGVACDTPRPLTLTFSLSPLFLAVAVCRIFWGISAARIAATLVVIIMLMLVPPRLDRGDSLWFAGHLGTLAGLAMVGRHA